MTERCEIAIAGREKVPGPDRELARSGPQGRAVWERGSPHVFRTMSIGGITLFTIASLACSMISTLPMLTAARIVQGLGASAIMSVNIALISYLYPRHRLGRGMGLNAFTVGVSFAVGPTIASMILSIAPWPWLFAANVPLGIAALAFALPSLPRTESGKHSFDPVAALLNVATFAPLVLALARAAQREPTSRVLIAAALASFFGILLVRREARHPAPMLPVDLFKRPVFALSVVTAMCSFAAQGLAFVSLRFFSRTFFTTARWKPDS